MAQHAGRLHRLYDGKREVRIYDDVDLNVPMLARMFDRRCRLRLNGAQHLAGWHVRAAAGGCASWPPGTLEFDAVW